MLKDLNMLKSTMVGQEQATRRQTGGCQSGCSPRTTQARVGVPKYNVVLHFKLFVCRVLSLLYCILSYL